MDEENRCMEEDVPISRDGRIISSGPVNDEKEQVKASCSCKKLRRIRTTTAEWSMNT